MKKHNSNSKIIAAAIVCGIIFGGIGGIVAGGILFPWIGKSFPALQRFEVFTPSPGSSQVIDKTVREVVNDSDAVIDAVKAVQPSVVSIIQSKDVTDFFGRTFESEVGGTGFIITSDGLIVTNRHVVSGEDSEYTVITNDGESFDAEVKAIDPSNDIAIMKIESDNLPVASLGYSDSLQVGQKVVAIGNALGEYSNSVTSGIVSGVNRTITTGNSNSSSYERLEGVIQTDAAINFGNSGGPLVDLGGSVVGVNTAIDQGGSLIGFAIPIDDVRVAIDSYLENGQIVRPMLGVRYIAITPEFAKINGLDVEYGALVYSPDPSQLLPVVPGGPADESGIEEGDIITRIDEEEIGKDKSLSYLIERHRPGDQVEVTFIRNGEEKKATVKLDSIDQ